MKNKILPLGVVLAILVSIISCVPSSNTTSNANTQSVLDTMLKTGTIKVGTTGDWVPMSYIDSDTGEFVGRDIDLIKEFAKDAGVEVEFVKTDWKSLVAGINSKRYDLTTTASYNLGRAEVVGYTDPIVNVYTVAIVRKELAGQFSQWEDLNDSSVTVATSLGTVFEELVNTLLPNATIKRVEPPARDFQEVITGKADVSITDSTEATLLKNKYPDAIEILDDPLPNANILALLTPRDDQVFINYVNTWIELKKQEGFFEALNDKWLNEK